jgi:hypothetical protein
MTGQRSKISLSRCRDPETLEGFKRLFAYVFSSATFSDLRGEQLDEVWEKYKALDHGRPKAVVSDDGREMFVFLYGTEQISKPVGAFQIRPNLGSGDQISAQDAHFCRCLSGVYNMDVATCSVQLRSDELWGFLRQSQKGPPGPTMFRKV